MAPGSRFGGILPRFIRIIGGFAHLIRLLIHGRAVVKIEIRNIVRGFVREALETDVQAPAPIGREIRGLGVQITVRVYTDNELDLRLSFGCGLDLVDHDAPDIARPGDIRIPSLVEIDLNTGLPVFDSGEDESPPSGGIRIQYGEVGAVCNLYAYCRITHETSCRLYVERSPEYLKCQRIIPVRGPRGNVDKRNDEIDNGPMSDLFYIIVPVIVVPGSVLLLTFYHLRERRIRESGGRKRDPKAVIKDARKRLSHNPRDLEALKSLADALYAEEDFTGAKECYKTLIDKFVPEASGFDEYELNIRYAISALRTEDLPEAYKSFTLARALRDDTFEVNANLGFVEYRRENYDKAAAFLERARIIRPEDPGTEKYLGYTLCMSGNCLEALPLLQKTAEVFPEDRETLYMLAQCYHSLEMNDPALRIFSHLRSHPQFGPGASLHAGTINLEHHQYRDAAADFEIGLKHESLRRDLRLELLYMLSSAYAHVPEISEAVKALEALREEDPDYKDTGEQLERYRELNSDQNLKVYLLGTTSEFVALCRKLTAAFHPVSEVKIVDISVHKTEYADILAEVSARRAEELVLLRFVRTSGDVGELILRDLYSRIKDLRAVKGYCVTAGQFTKGARDFVEARLIDLVGKDGLTRVLSSLGYRKDDP